MEDPITKSNVVLKTTPARLLASYEMTVPTNEQVPEYFDKAHQRLWAFVKEHNLRVVGPHMTIWHQGPEVIKNEIVEVTFEIDAAVPGEGDIRVYVLPETQVASFVHQGNFKEFQIGHQILVKWIQENGYRAPAGYREIYVKHDANDLGHSITEIQFPVVKIASDHEKV